MTTVSTSYGQLEGTVEDGIHVFKGIPFAAPPVGPLRFAAPQPPAAWSGVRDATTFGNSSLQNPMPALEAMMGGAGTQQAPDEDCLYLNIWTQGTDGPPRPVMVWIHGGAFTIGSGSDGYSNGRHLAARGVVVVTINYRLGALGFLSVAEAGVPAGEATANFGLLDQVAALRWVRDEIAAFGGDPDNVTIFGESAGGMSVGSLMGSPLASGLFHKAIPQSGAAHNAADRSVTSRTAAAFAKVLGLETFDLAALRSIPAARFLEAQTALEAEMAASGVPALPFQPVVDGHFLPERAIDAVRNGRTPAVPTLIGTTAEEWKLLALMAPGKVTAETLGAQIEALTTAAGSPGKAPAVRAAYEAALAADSSAAETWSAIMTDFMFRVPADRLAEAEAGRGAPVYSYVLDWKSPIPDLGACHAIDLPLMFGTFRAMPMFAGDSDETAALSSKMIDAWTAFARIGNPGVESLPAWPRYDATSRPSMILGHECHVVNGYREVERAAWTGIIT